MADILYTTTDQVVAVLGATDRDLTEVQLVAMDLETELGAELYQWVPTHATVHSLASTDAAHRQMDNLLILACKYYCAWLVAQSSAISLLMQVRTQMGDEMQRTQFNPEKLRDEMWAGYAKNRAALVLMLTPTAPLKRTQIAVGVSNLYDPVTG